MKKTVLNTALSTAFIVALGISVSACSGDKESESHEVLAVDRVDDAAKLARENAPEAEDMNFPETAPMPVADAATDGTATDGTATDGTVTDATATEDGATAPEASDATSTESATTETAVAGAASTEASETEPATN